MIRVALGGVVLAATMSTAAMAADLIVDTPVYEAAMTAAHDWSGFYIGGQVGYGWATGSMDDLDGPGTTFDPDIPEWTMSGGLAGVYAGFNGQFDSVVLGVEADVNGAWISGSDIVDTSELGGTIDWLASIRGRAGVAFDNTMLFVTAGYAGAGATHFQEDSGDVSATLTGWTAGAGVEHAFTEEIAGRVEYRYYSLGVDDVDMPAAFTTRDYDIGLHTVTAGVSFAF